jgi:Type IV secretion system pilin
LVRSVVHIAQRFRGCIEQCGAYTVLIVYISMKSFILRLTAVATMATPLVAAAQATGLESSISLINNILNSFIPILITCAILAFFWGLVKFLFQGAKDEKTRKEGINLMTMGIIAITVMVSVWGLVRILQNTFKISSTDPILPKPIKFNQ